MDELRMRWKANYGERTVVRLVTTVHGAQLDRQAEKGWRARYCIRGRSCLSDWGPVSDSRQTVVRFSGGRYPLDGIRHGSRGESAEVPMPEARSSPLSAGLEGTANLRRVAVLDDYQGRAHEYADWNSLADEIEVSFFHAPIPASDLPKALAGSNILVIMRERTPLPRAVLEQLPNVEFVTTTGMVNASIDIGYLSERGIAVSGTDKSDERDTPGVPGPVEVAWALIFAAAKRVTIEDRAIRAGSWQLDLPTSLAGSTLGLAGLGRLGGSMVAPARIFGMEVIAWSEHLTDERADEMAVERVSKNELLQRSDVFSIHLVLSDRTRGLFRAEDLTQMKRSAILINTSRGPIVEEQALVDALREGTIAAAGLDVFDQEPLPPDHDLGRLEKTVLLPHLGYANERAFRSMYRQSVENIAAFLAGSPIRVLS